jgi:hypothetical protein
MQFTINIPEWLLWLLGVPVGLGVICFAILGVYFLFMLSQWRY